MPEETKTRKTTLDLSRITAGPLASNKPDAKTEQEEKSYEKDRKEAELQSYRQDIIERKTYASRIFRLVVGWLALLFILLFIQGALSPHGYFNLSDKVILALIGGTTVNVLGLFIIVANYLFPKAGNSRTTAKKPAVPRKSAKSLPSPPPKEGEE